jgi:hypothetical protein
VGFGTILERVGGSFLAILDLRWGMAQNSIWHYVWCRDQALKTTFTDLFSIARFKDAALADYLELFSTSHQCNINFLRAAHNWGMGLFTSLFTLLYYVRVSRDGEDKLCWIPSKRGLFEV